MTAAAYFARRNQNLSRHKEIIDLGPTMASFMIIIAVFLLAFLYLLQITKTNTFGAQINNLNHQHTELLQQQQNLQLEAARLQSITKIQNSNVAKSMTPVQQAIYIK